MGQFRKQGTSKNEQGSDNTSNVEAKGRSTVEHEKSMEFIAYCLEQINTGLPVQTIWNGWQEKACQFEKAN